MIRTAEQYKQGLRDGRVVYYQGERVNDVTVHPTLKVCVELASMDYVLAQDPRYQHILVERNGDGEPISFVYTVPKRAEDLLRRREIIQLLARTCLGLPGGAKFTGIDAMMAITVVCKTMDKQIGANYSERVELFRKHLQRSDPSIVAAMTDVKGDRSLRPSRQLLHQDYYVRVVEHRSDGIVVRGAKAHVGFTPCADEMIVMPCRRHREEDKEYAVAFAIPPNTKGVTVISGARDVIEEGNYFDYPLTASLYAGDSLIVFDDVFVPMDRVFLNGEWQFSGDMAHMFGNFHRVAADAYKYAELEIVVGAAALMAEYNGLENIPHIQEKLSWLTMYCEATEALGQMACVNLVTETDSGLVYPNPMYSNIAKLFFADNFHQAIKYVQDIAGGIVATMPSSKDFFNPETRRLMEKYLGGKAGVLTEDRLRAVKLVRDISSAYHAVGTIHGEGSLAAQRLSIYGLADFERYKAAAKRAARIRDGKDHTVFSTLPPFPAS